MKERFYTTLSDFYDEIFPVSDSMADFILSGIPDYRRKRILDIGCATGALALKLSQSAGEITGIDLDEIMIEKALGKAGKSGIQNVNFQQGDMTRIGELFEEGTFDSVICMGNTLVHLNNLGSVSSFFRSVHSVLRPEGIFIFQIMNYDRISSYGQSSLPVIETDSVVFRRNYFSSGEKIDFEGVLLEKRTGKESRNSVSLLPLLYKDIKVLLDDAGFTTEFFGGFNRQRWSPESELLIGIGKRT